MGIVKNTKEKESPWERPKKNLESTPELNIQTSGDDTTQQINV